MQTYYHRFLVVLFIIATFFATATAVRVIKLPPNISVPAIYAFGDSIVDAGNNNDLKSIIKCNHPPYGKDFMGGLATGRFSNGRIPTDLLAEALSIKKYVPAYVNKNLSPEEILTGVTFASGAAGYDPLTPKLVSVISLPDQLGYFKESIETMKQSVGEERTDFILKNSVFFVVAGSDDIANTYFDTPFRRLHYDVDSYTNLMVDSASSFIQDLYNVGARRIGVFAAAPVGCVPSQRTIGGGITRECAENYNEACSLFNSKLSTLLDSLSPKLPDSKLVYVDIYTPLLDIIKNPQSYGFEQSVRGCCGTGLIEVSSLLCNKLDALCPDDSKYLFWDSYHPTERGYEILVDSLTEKYITPFF